MSFPWRTEIKQQTAKIIQNITNEIVLKSKVKQTLICKL